MNCVSVEKVYLCCLTRINLKMNDFQEGNFERLWETVWFICALFRFSLPRSFLCHPSRFFRRPVKFLSALLKVAPSFCRFQGFLKLEFCKQKRIPSLKKMEMTCFIICISIWHKTKKEQPFRIIPSCYFSRSLKRNSKGYFSYKVFWLRHSSF
jgi:hypothetical protein